MKKQILLAVLLFLGSALIGVGGFASAATISSDLSSFALDENPLSSNFSRTFNIELSPSPTSEVTTSFATNGECLLGHNNKGFTTGGSVYTLNGSLYFGIRTLDDDDFENQHTCDISFTSISTTDPNYLTQATQNYSFIVSDNDTNDPPSFNVATLTTARMQEGGAFVEKYEVQIAKAAKDDILVTAIADDQCDILQGNGDDQVRVRTLEKTIPGGSLAAVSFTIIPREDNEFEGIHQCSIQHAISTDDLEYSGISAPPYITSIADNDANPNIPDEREYEGGLIYFKDANYDGIEDSKQPNVLSFINKMHGNRQGLVITDDEGQLNEDCRFISNVKSIKFDSETQSSQIRSSQGELDFEVRCNGDGDYRLMWILDQYYEAARNWVVYQTDVNGNLTPAISEHLVYNLGDDFTSALLIAVEEQDSLILLQSEPTLFDQPARLDDDLGASATDGASKFSLMYIGIGSFAALVIWTLYNRFIKLFDSRKTNAPEIDRF